MSKSIYVVGRCDYCETKAVVLRPTPFFGACDMMCKECWDDTEEEYRNCEGTYIGKFEDGPGYEEVTGIEQWCYSLNGDEYEGYYDSKEEAIQAGDEAACNEDLNSFWVGKAEKTFAPSVDVDYFLERLMDRAVEEGGEHGESYLDGVTGEQEAELEEKMNEVLNTWLDKHGHEVNFYSVTNEEEINSSN